ncbi:MAG: hypothetical protein Q9174_006068 [Haloplaca sp. 1 TL-2023]
MALLDTDDMNQMQDVGEEWMWEHSRRFHLAIITIAAINVLAACSMIVMILFDARKAARSRKPVVHDSLQRHLTKKISTLFDLHPADVLPLIITLAVVVQGTIFIAVETSFDNTVTIHCKTIAQIKWPTMWIVLYTMLVFGLETSLRSFGRRRFRPQSSRNALFCVTLAAILVLITWAPSTVAPIQGSCLASLMWWTVNYAKLGLIIASTILMIYLVCLAVITMRLFQVAQIDHSQRISATRTVVYLAFAVVVVTLTLPFFAQRLTGKEAMTTSQVAEVALNALGIIHLITHVFLRSNVNRTAIQPKGNKIDRKKPFRISDPSGLELTMHITSPVLLEKEVGHRYDDDNNHNLVSSFSKTTNPTTNTTTPSGNPSISHSDNQTKPTRPRAKPSLPLTPRPIARKPSSKYSIFPTHSSAMLRNSTSTTFSHYTQENPASTTFSHSTQSELLQPPKPIHTHKRDLSEQSSATVHIGFRFSGLNDPDPQNAPPSPTPSSFVLPIYDACRSTIDYSPPVSPLSVRPDIVGGMDSGDSMTLPLQDGRPDSTERLRRSIINFLTPDRARWRRGSPVAPRGQVLSRSMTMKALPPDPPV